MVRHIVLWKFKEENKAQNAAEIKRRLEALVGQIEGLRRLEVGVHANDNGFDACLIGDYDSFEALAFYRAHPLHKAAQTIVHAAMTERVSFDYELPD